MKKYVLAILVVRAMVPSLSFAGGEGSSVGNGGDALVCYGSSGNIESVEFYDSYEARSIRKIRIDLGPSHLSVDKKIELVLSRLRKLHKYRADLYEDRFEHFFDGENFKWVENLEDIPDMGNGDWPANCKSIQVAITKAPQLPGDKRYKIRRSLYDLMDNNSKALLILHEIIYRDFNEMNTVNAFCGYQHHNSEFVRFYNETLASAQLSSMSDHSYIDLLSRVKNCDYEKAGIRIHTRESRFDFSENGSLLRVTGGLWGEITQGIKFWDRFPEYEYSVYGYGLPETREAFFSSEGALLEIRGATFDGSHRFGPMNAMEVRFKGDFDLRFHPNRVLRSIKRRSGSRLEIDPSGECDEDCKPFFTPHVRGYVQHIEQIEFNSNGDLVLMAGKEMTISLTQDDKYRVNIEYGISRIIFKNGRIVTIEKSKERTPHMWLTLLKRDQVLNGWIPQFDKDGNGQVEQVCYVGNLGCFKLSFVLEAIKRQREFDPSPTTSAASFRHSAIRSILRQRRAEAVSAASTRALSICKKMTRDLAALLECSARCTETRNRRNITVSCEARP